MAQWYEFGKILINLDVVEKIEKPKKEDKVWVVTLHYVGRDAKTRTLQCSTDKRADEVYTEIKKLVLKSPYVIPFKLLE